MANKINVDYSVSFHLEGDIVGKRKATIAKAKEIEKQSNRFHFVSLNKMLTKFIGVYFATVYTELVHSLRIIFSKEKPNVIFTRTFFGYFYNFLRLFYPIRVIREMHTEFKDDSKIVFKSFNKKKLGIVVNYFEVKSLKKADGVIFNNPDLEDYFVETYGLKREKTTSIYNACEPTDFFPGNKIEARNELRLNLSDTGNDVVMLFIGSAIEWHGLEYLIEVFEEIHKMKQNYYLYIVGLTDSDYNLSLKETYSGVENLHLVDRVSTDKARMYINASDICMVTTAKILISQGSPTKLYDFVACGKPVISQENVRGYGTVVDEHGLGLTVDFMNPKEAACKIISFVEEANLEQIGMHNRKKAVEELNWSNAISRWIDFAKSV